MRRRGIRIALFITTLALQAGVVYKLIETDQRLTAARLQMDRFDAQIDRALATTTEFRAAIQAYVAPGQGEPFWSGRVGELIQSLEARVVSLGDGAAADAAASLTVVTEQVKGFRELDTRARGLLAQGDRLMASDLAFGEVQEACGNLAGQLEETRRREATTRLHEVVVLRTIEVYLLASALGIGAIGLLLLLPAWRPATSGTAEAVAPAPTSSGLGLARSPIANRRAKAGDSPAGIVVSPSDLASTARLCSDLGRVADAAALPALLARAAGAIGASGLIVWVTDVDDGALRPVAGHGYTDDAVARIGAVPRDSDNATAAASRSGEIETVPAAAGAPGALAVPMMTSAGCVGVLAAEVKGGREADEATRAIATIVAAQLATLVLQAPSGPRA